MKKTLLCLYLSLAFIPASAFANAQRDDDGLSDQSSINQQKEIKKIEQHIDKISPKDKNHVGHTTPDGWKISKNPEVDNKGNVKITAKKDGKVSTVTVSNKQAQNKIATTHNVKKGGRSLFIEIALDIAKDMYGEIDNLAIIGDTDASWFDKFYNFIFNRQSDENLSQLKLKFDLPPHGYYWYIHSRYSGYYVYDGLSIPSLEAVGNLCKDEKLTWHIGGRGFVAKFISDDDQTDYSIYCVPSSAVARYSSYPDDYSIYHNIRQSTNNEVSLSTFIPDVVRSIPINQSAKNLVQSMAVVDVLAGDYDKEFKQNEVADPSPEQLPQPEPYTIYYPNFMPSTNPNTSPVTSPSPIGNPSPNPVGSPSGNPSSSPSSNPVGSPSSNPVGNPSSNPSSNPVGNPSTSPINSPSPNPSPLPFQLPAFCAWATPVCDFIGWVKQEPQLEQKDDERPEINDIVIEQAPSSFDIDYLNYGGQCPSLDAFSIPVGFGQSIEMQFDISPLCDFALKVRPAILAIAYLMAMMIVGRAVQNS